MSISLDRLLDTQETADVLNVHKQWLEHARLKGEGPHFVRIGNRVRYRPLDVHQWIENGLTQK